MDIKIVLNFEWSSVYGTDRPIPFLRKFRIACPLRAVNLRTPKSGKNPWKGPIGRARWSDETQRLVGRSSNVGGQFIIRHPNKILPPPCITSRVTFIQVQHSAGLL